MARGSGLQPGGIVAIPEPYLVRLRRTLSVTVGGYKRTKTKDPATRRAFPIVDLTGHYLNSILERRTEELQRKTAELEALCVAQYD